MSCFICVGSVWTSALLWSFTSCSSKTWKKRYFFIMSFVAVGANLEKTLTLSQQMCCLLALLSCTCKVYSKHSVFMPCLLCHFLWGVSMLGRVFYHLSCGILGVTVASHQGVLVSPPSSTSHFHQKKKKEKIKAAIPILFFLQFIQTFVLIILLRTNLRFYVFLSLGWCRVYMVPSAVLGNICNIADSIMYIWNISIFVSQVICFLLCSLVFYLLTYMYWYNIVHS